MQMELDPMTNFILPGGHTTVSYTHIARSICRRSERIINELNSTEIIPQIILPYINRLSDYLFVLSRKLSKDLKIKEELWEPRM